MWNNKLVSQSFTTKEEIHDASRIKTVWDTIIIQVHKYDLGKESSVLRCDSFDGKFNNWQFRCGNRVMILDVAT